MPDLKTLCIDFDGVIHRYSAGWQNGLIYDEATEGFFEWAERTARFFRLVIYSSRSKDPQMRAAMEAWMKVQQGEWERESGRKFLPVFEFAHEKPAAWLTIDDRALTFRGDWLDFEPENLLRFKPWTADL